MGVAQMSIDEDATLRPRFRGRGDSQAGGFTICARCRRFPDDGGWLAEVRHETVSAIPWLSKPMVCGVCATTPPDKVSRRLAVVTAKLIRVFMACLLFKNQFVRSLICPEGLNSAHVGAWVDDEAKRLRTLISYGF
jgi:hypothetical protein